MSSLALENYLIVGALLFVLGMIGFLTRRNMIIMFLSAELMLQGVSINLLAFSRFRGHLGGQALVMFILTVAACEAAIALAMILVLYRSRRTLDVSVWQDLREPTVDPILDPEPDLPIAPAPMPKLTPSGVEPKQPHETSHV